VSEIYWLDICGSESGSESGSGYCDLCDLLPDTIPYGYVEGFNELTGYVSSTFTVISKDISDNLWKWTATMVKPNCPPYTLEVDIECVDGVLSSTRAIQKFNNTSIDLKLEGLGAINNCTPIDDCLAISMTGFVLSWKDPNDPQIPLFYNYIGQQCLCTTDCKPTPPPPCILIPKYVNVIQNIEINNGALSKNTAVIETFDIEDITTQQVLPLTSCNNLEIAPFVPVNIEIGSSTNVSCYDTVSIVRDILFIKDHLIVVKSNIKILSINNPISDIIVDTIIDCETEIMPSTVPPNSISPSTNTCDDFINNEDIIIVTDVYIENNILKYRTANIKVPKIITANNTNNIILLTNCPNP